jgi:phosphate acetyltransferase
VATSIYVASAEGHSGKSSVALGVLDTLLRTVETVGVFRPLIRSTDERDYVLEMLLGRDGVTLAYDDAVGVTYDEVHADADAALSRIVDRFKEVERRHDAVVIVGSDYTDVASPTELAFNARVAANLGAPVLLVLTGRELDESRARTPDELRQVAELALPELATAHATLLAVIANRADPERLDEITRTIEEQCRVPAWAMPEDPFLVAPTVEALMAAVDGTLLKGDRALLARESLAVVIAAMSMENVLPRLVEGGTVIIPGDRSDVVLAALTAHASGTFPSLAGIVLNGGFDLSPVILRLIEGLDETLPIITTELGTWAAAQRISQTRGKLTVKAQRKIDTALALFERHIDAPRLLTELGAEHAEAVTPLMFEYTLLERARAADRHIVLPEGSDDRILQAAGTLLSRGVVRLTILGDANDVRARAAGLGIHLSSVEIIDPATSEHHERFAEEYARLRAHKGVTLESARETMRDVSYFGTMMVQLGIADGMVSGAQHTTAHTITPAFEFVKTKEGVSIVSSVFFMALDDRVLVYGDCAVVPDPTATQLADIAISAAATAAQFGIEPRIAMLSYSTGESGSGADVDKVREATALVRERRPDLLVEGPIQYDAAADAAVAKTKMPDSQVAGRATVFIFPDLNTGNNTYKAVQRSSGAIAIGPVLQGLRKPVNDLSRGALVRDIVNTVAITAIQSGGAGSDASRRRDPSSDEAALRRSAP